MAFDPLTAGLDLGKSFLGILGKFIPDADKAQQAAMELAQEANVQVMGQIELNKADSASTRLFVAGWRPSVGWICAGGLGYQIIFRPILQSILWIWFPSYQMVSLEIETLMTLLFGMLGLGAYRTFEKSKGVA